MVGAKWYDPVVGVDIHFVMVPTPAGPIPTPLPHPFTGLVFDPAGLIVGAAISAGMMAFGSPFQGPVTINMQPAANTGTEATNKMVMPHFPTPPGTAWAPTPTGPKPPVPGKPPDPPSPAPVPSNDAIMITGSKTVYISGTNACRLGDLAMSCGEPLRLPSSTCIAVPMGMPVMIGGPPALDLMAALMGMIKTQYVSSKLHDVFNAAPGSWRSRAICFLTGHPVDVASGMVMTDHTDFQLPGPLPFKFERVYYSRSSYEGPLGHGWGHTYDQFIRIERKRVVYHADDGRDIYFPLVDDGKSRHNPHERMTLRRKGETYRIDTGDGLKLDFGSQNRADGTLPLLRIEDLNGNKFSLTYDEAGHLIEIIDSVGRKITLQNDRQGRLVALNTDHPDIKGQRLDVVRFEYDRNGDLVAAYDAMGHAYHYAYKNHLLVQETNRNGLSFYFAYDGIDQDAWCVRTWGDDGIFDHVLMYDKQKHMTIVEDSHGKPTVYYWNAAGLVEQIVDPLGNIVEREYDEFFRLKSAKNANGDASVRTYDDEGRLIELIDAAGRKSEIEYDENGCVKTMRRPDGTAIHQQFDQRRNLIARRDAKGGQWRYSYDTRGNLVEVRNPVGGLHRFRYNEHCRLVEWRDEHDAKKEYQYNGYGQLKTIRNPLGKETHIDRDLMGRRLRIRYPDESRLQWRYDAEGNTTAKVDRDGLVTQYRYAGFNKLHERIEPSGHHLYYRYDTENRLLGLRNQRGEECTFKRDETGRVQSFTDFDRTQIVYIRDPAGFITAVEEIVPQSDDGDRPPVRRRTEYQRDPTGLLLSRILSTGETYEYEYDVLGRLMKAKSPEHLIEREYDGVGNLIEERQDDESVRYEYDIVGRITRRTTSFNRGVRYEYDETGRLMGVSIERNEGRAIGVQYTRSATGAVVGREWPNGIEHIERNEVGQIVRTERSSGGRIVHRREHSYDVSGTLTQVEDSDLGSMTFQYDPMRRLTSVLRADEDPVNFEFDPAGNITRAGLTSYEIGSGNRLTRRNGQPVMYDPFGNLSKRETGSNNGTSKQVLIYDAAGYLRRIENDQGEMIAEYEYDALSRRVRKRTPMEDIRYLWDGTRLLAEVGDDTKREYVFDGFIPLAQVTENDTYFFHCDHLGTPLAMTDETGETVWSGRYDPYGALIAATGAVHQPLRLPGQYADAETGLSYHVFRYYDPRDGRFIQKDPIGLQGGLNVYAYARNPITWSDPLGLAECGELPEGSRVVNEADDYVIYVTRDGAERIRFRASEAVTLQEATSGRNYTTDAMAGLTDDGAVMVHEGRHRAIGAAQGDRIPSDVGGVDDAPGWLDYEYTPDAHDGRRVPVRDLEIDYDPNHPDVGRDQADQIFDQRINGGGDDAPTDVDFDCRPTDPL